jgi:DNA-binding CsgD family transcriptional regulator
MKLTAKQRASLSDLRLACCQSLGDRMVVPLALELLRELLPHQCASFAWVSDRGEVVDSCLWNIDPQALLRYYRDFYRRPIEEEVRPSISALATSGVEIENSTSYRMRLPGSAIHEAFCEPLEIGNLLRAVVRADGRPLAVMELCGHRSEDAFSRRDEALLRSVLPYLAHAMTVEHAAAERWIEHGDEGVVIVDRAGHVQHADHMARHLLFLAVGGGSVRQGAGAVRELLARLLRQFDQSITRPVPAPASMQIDNRWGSFSLRAHDLGETPSSPGPFVAVRIRRRIPLTLRLLNGLRRLPLSERQKQVCLLVCRGLTLKEIAREMAIGVATVDDYLRVIYQRLGVNGREGLIMALMLST